MLELHGLSRAYEGFEFGPVDLSVGNEVLSVLGPSGSGKTTLLSLVAGITPPDSGAISLDGSSLVGRSLDERRTGLVFQDGALFPHMTARENIAYSARDSGRVQELADLFEIGEVLDRRPRALSGGERQRVALARTIASSPDALLLDEPLSSLDTPIRRRLRDELHGVFRSLEIPIVYVTHDQRAATVLGDRIAVLRDGRVEQVGSPSSVLDRPATRFVAEFSGTENVFSAEIRDRDGETVSLGVGNLTLQATGTPRVGTTVTACIRPSHLQLHSQDDEDGPGENTLLGTVRRRLHEGDRYRVEVAVDDAQIDLTATVPSTSFEQLSTDAGSRVRLSVPPDGIHLIE